MTCEDCSHFKKITYPKGVTLPDDDIAKTHGNCTVSKVNVWVKPSCEPCELFEDKDGTFYNGTEHCPRCGRPVPKWGLCDECARLYGSWESVSK